MAMRHISTVLGGLMRDVRKRMELASSEERALPEKTGRPEMRTGVPPVTEPRGEERSRLGTEWEKTGDREAAGKSLGNAVNQFESKLAPNAAKALQPLYGLPYRQSR